MLVHVAFAVVFAVVSSAYATPPRKRAKAAFAKAEKAWEAKDYPRALDALEEAVQLRPRPEYVYNYARVLEKLGRLGDAHRAFLRVVADRSSPKSLRKLAGAGAEQLATSATVAVVNVSAVARRDKLLQIGKRLLTGSANINLSPGRYQICWLPIDTGSADCWFEELGAGRRIDQLLRPPPRIVGTLTWHGKSASRITLNGNALMVEPAKLTEILVEPGSHVVQLMDNGVAKRVAVTVGPGERVELAPEAPPKDPPVVLGEAVEAPVAGGTADVWPWVVTGLGGAILGGGVALVVLGDSAQSVDVDTTAGIRTSSGTTQAQHAESWDRGLTLKGAGGALVGVGSAAVIGGILWWALTPRGNSEAQVRVPRVLFSPGHVTVELSF